MLSTESTFYSRELRNSQRLHSFRPEKSEVVIDYHHRLLWNIPASTIMGMILADDITSGLLLILTYGWIQNTRDDETIVLKLVLKKAMTFA